MVNNVNGTNPNLYVDTRNNSGQQRLVNPPVQQGGYKTDGYAFNMSNTVNSGPVPDVKVGFMDKMGITFKDVMPTDENTKRFVAFEKDMKSNPQGYLSPGENDVTATTDLQKKLKMIGYNVTVNGQFGNSTEQAVTRFKNSVGINDGYLTKNGNFAVSGIVTPQTWAVLNASVAARMNPNSNLSSGTYTPPVTQTELKWAKDLQGKIATYGYRPSDTERTKYEDIYQRQRVGMQAQSGTFDPTKVSPPTEQELAWAQDLAVKIKQFGYKPTQAESGKYQEIYQRINMNKAGNANSTSKPQPVQQNTQVTQNDVDWAVNLMNKIKGGYKPSSAETQKYENIYNAMQNGQAPQKKNSNSVEPATQTAPTTTQKTGVPSKDELTWASKLEAKVSQGYNPTSQEKDKYNDIFARYSASKTAVSTPTENTAPKTKTGQPSDEEIQWASNFEKKVNSGEYQPSQKEVDKYNDIATRLTASQDSEPVQKPENNQPIEKPKNVSNKSNDPFHGRTVEKFGKVGSAADDWNKKHKGTAFPRNNVFYPNRDGQLISQSQVNSASKSGGNYVGKLDLSNAPALYIPGFSSTKAQDYSYVNGKIYNNSALDETTKLSVRPTSQATQQTPEPSKQQVQQPAITNQVDPNQNTENTNKPSNQEIQWALDLEKKVSSGSYNPTDADIAKYTDISNRLKASTPTNQTAQQPAQTTGVSKEELDWAVNFQAQTAQGYQPTAQEMATYTDIYNRHQGGAVTTQTTTQPQVQDTQNVSIDLSNGDPELAWALNLLDNVQKGYTPTQDEIATYEQVIAKNQSTPARP